MVQKSRVFPDNGESRYRVNNDRTIVIRDSLASSHSIMSASDRQLRGLWTERDAETLARYNPISARAERLHEGSLSILRLLNSRISGGNDRTIGNTRTSDGTDVVLAERSRKERSRVSTFRPRRNERHRRRDIARPSSILGKLDP